MNTSTAHLAHTAAPHRRAPRLALGRVAVLCGALAAGLPSLAAAADETHAPGRILVMPLPGLSDANFVKVLNTHGGRARKVGRAGLHIVDLPTPGNERVIAAQLARHPHIKFAEVDQRLPPNFAPNDPYAGSQWHLTKIGAATAWDVTQGAGVTVAILDSGVDGSHPDLAASMVAGWNFYDNNANTADVQGHGTAVAGTVAALSNNGAGVASVAGAAKIMPVRISDANAWAYFSTIAQGLTWAADNGARVANVSYGGVTGSAAVQQAAQYMKSKGGLVFVSAGNNGVAETYAPTTTMVTVSATDANDQLTGWSSYGPAVTLAAPGDNIWTTSRGGNYGQWWGTSFSSPVAAGVAALVMSAKPQLSSSQVESLLYATAVDLGAAGRDDRFGFGRVDAGAAMRAAIGIVTPAPDAQAPSASIGSPSASSTVSGLVNVAVDAADNVGVARVELRANGVLVGTDTAAPFAFIWDTAGMPNGMANLVAQAFDAAGNTASSTVVSVNVANAAATPDTTPPTVRIANPLGGKVNGNITISTSASDDRGTAGISQALYIDGALKATASGATLIFNWNARKAAAGGHSIQVVATDAAGNKSTAAVQVTR